MQACRRVACSRARVSAGSGPRGMAWPPPRAWPSPGLSAGAGLPWPSSVAWPSSGSWPPPWLSPEAWPWSWLSPLAWPPPWRPAAGPGCGWRAGRRRRRGPGRLRWAGRRGGCRPGSGRRGWSWPWRPAGVWSWVWRVSHRPVSWSRACQSICPVTTVVSIASQAAASAAAPVRYTDPGPAAARAQVQDRSRTEPPRRSFRSTWTVRWAGWPSRPGISCPAISRRQASSIASWRRCARVRVSSGPAFWPRASSTTVSAAAQAGVRSPWSRPAPPKVVSSHSARSSNPSSPVSGPVRARSSISRASRARSC